MEYNQWLHDVLYKFSSLDNYRDSIHYWDSFTTTIVIVKFLLSLSTTNFNLKWDIGQSYPVYSDDIIVITLNLGSASVSCNNNDITLVLGYKYNLMYTKLSFFFLYLSYQ